MAEHVEVKQSKIAGAGRGLFARKNFAPGDIVAAVDRPLVAECDDERMLDTCSWCFHRAITEPEERAQAASMGLPMGFTEVKICTGCRRVAYCSKKCQSKAWKLDHKHECKILAVPDRPSLPPPVRAVVKLLGRLKADPAGSNSKLLDLLKFKPFAGGAGLEEFERNNKDSNNKSRIDDFNMLSYAAWHYCDKPNFSFASGELVAKGFLFAFYCNQVSLSSPLDEGQYGSSFDPLICSANHSCEPNAIITFAQPRQIMRAVKPIKLGDEIYVHYVDVTNPFGVRQLSLKEGYYFNCRCSKCKRGSKFSQDEFRKMAEDLDDEYFELADNLAQRHRDVLDKYMVPANNAKAQERLTAMQAEAFSVAQKKGAVTVDDIKKALEMCVDSGMWAWTRQPVPKLCKNLFSLYLARADVYRAFRVGIKMYFEIMPVLSPETFQPERLIMAWNLSTVVNVLCGPMHEQVCNELAKEAGIELRVVYCGLLFDLHDNIGKIYDEESPFGVLVNGTYDQIIPQLGRPEHELRDKVKVAWPKVEILARSISADTI
ncbi:[histone H3]-lysine4/36 N-trimethyltransferase SMYD [Microdochium nivale]|nr:[histone H3]-lysine4/36 N-trimethyltransferase SMYD [Microdochium nivale]